VNLHSSLKTGIRLRGSGTLNIIDLCDENGSTPPTWSEQAGSVFITLEQENSLFNGLTHSHTVFLVLGLWSLVEGEKWLLYRALKRSKPGRRLGN
jgi:hypothetical protein